MSNLYVRENVMAFLQAEVPTEKFVDMTGEFDELQDFLRDSGVSPGENWVGVQFIAGAENPVDVRGTNDKGKYREEGTIYLHVVGKSGLTAHKTISPRGETIKNALRGQRIASSILVESLTGPNFGVGATLNFTNGYTAAAVYVEYTYEINL